MDIAAYLDKYKITQSDFAKKVGVSQVAVSYWLSGIRPHPKTSCKIFELTKGKISFTDLGWDATHEERLNKILARRKRDREYTAKRKDHGKRIKSSSKKDPQSNE